MAKKDKYACFQWIRDVRAKMSADMESMTPEERVAYIRAGAEKALSKMPKLGLEEARRQRRAILHPEDKSASTPKTKANRKTPSRRKASKRLAHA
jgi:hypothetical protein